MQPTLTIGNATVYSGNNLDILPTLPDNSVDSIVCDPPYELGFMGKSWDSSGIAYSVELWQECFRVLKPGGHLLAFGGTRTWHRLAVAVEDAGFEIRDNIAWLYGSGFPKSHNISKAIDKRGGKEIAWFGLWLKEWRKENKISQKEVAALFPSNTGNLTGCVANWELGFNLPTAEQFSLICKHFDLPFESIEEAERTVIGTKLSGIANKKEGQRHTIGASKAVEVDITISATDEAKAWDGWGTALKPAHEPIVVARKPVIGTVAENVLKYGTGGINIDATRIGTEVRPTGLKKDGSRSQKVGNEGWDRPWKNDERANRVIGDGEAETTLGRWPANIILDEYTAELLDEQSGILKSGAMNSITKGHDEETFNTYGKQYVRRVVNQASSGGASRFFYVAKANKRDRNEGLENIEGKEISAKGNGLARTCNTCGATTLDGCDCPDRTFSNPVRQNFHPTVKPTALMQYLIRLVTPANGVVLDPFAGSGSTGKAAILENKHFIGIELTPEYLPIIEGRLTHAHNTMQQQQEDDLFE